MINILVLRPPLGRCWALLLAAARCRRAVAVVDAVAADALPSQWPSTRCLPWRGGASSSWAVVANALPVDWLCQLLWQLLWPFLRCASYSLPPVSYFLLPTSYLLPSTSYFLPGAGRWVSPTRGPSL